MVKISEKLLLSRLQKKDKEAFSKAYNLYIDQIYRFIYFKVGNKEEAEDLTSAVFLKTWNHIQSTNPGNFITLKPLIYKIARTTIIDHYRKKSQQENITINDINNPIDIIDKEQNIYKQAELSSDIKLIESKLLELKDEYQEVIILRYVDELSISEISEIMEKPKGNVRVLLHRSLKALRELLGPNNG